MALTSFRDTGKIFRYNISIADKTTFLSARVNQCRGLIIVIVPY